MLLHLPHHRLLQVTLRPPPILSFLPILLEYQNNQTFDNMSAENVAISARSAWSNFQRLYDQFQWTHSRGPSTLGSVKDGVSDSRGDVGTIKQGEPYNIDFE